MTQHFIPNIPTQLVRAVEDHLLVQAILHTRRDMIVPLQACILAENEFYTDSLAEPGRRVLTHDQIPFMAIPDMERYCAIMHKVYLENGFTPTEVGDCPLLEAENLLVQADAVVLDAAFPITHRRSEDLMLDMQIRRQMVKFIVQMVIAHSGINSDAILARYGLPETQVPS